MQDLQVRFSFSRQFLKIFPRSHGPLRFHMNVRVFFFSYFWNKWHWYFDRKSTESVDHFGWYTHFNNIKCFNLWTWNMFPFVLYSLISFSSAFVTVSVQLFNFFKFVPKCFIIFDAIVNDSVFLISFLDWSLLMYRHTSNFWVLILVPATLLN